MNTEKVPTILYGGAFNPPTKAHAMILDALADHARQTHADVWLLPSGNRRDKTITADTRTRLSYMHALFASVDTTGIETNIESCELLSELPTETVDTHMRLQKRHPEREFSWVFGSDSVNTMRQWHRGSWLLEHLRMIVIERPGYPLVEQPKRREILQLGAMAVSSTDVRARLHGGASVDDLVPPPVVGVLRQAGMLA